MIKRLKTDVLIIGDGCLAMLAANHLLTQNLDVVLLNPRDEFGVDDLRPSQGLTLWDAVYRSEGNVSLSEFYDTLSARLREVFPAPLEQSGLAREEHWAVLSSTPIHRPITETLEKEFFRIERKEWSSGQFRLVNPEHVLSKARQMGLEVNQVAQVEGAIVRKNALWWDAPRMGLYLSQFIRTKFNPESGRSCFTGAKIKGKYGRKVVIETSEGEEVSIESRNAVHIYLSGEILPSLKTIVASCEESWIQGVRKRRRERHFASFARNRLKGEEERVSGDDGRVWLELGATSYRWSLNEGTASWQSQKGPDGIEKVIDEGLRLSALPERRTRFTRSTRAFALEWDWKSPRWCETSHDTHWATGFEGDLWNSLELLWNLPQH